MGAVLSNDGPSKYLVSVSIQPNKATEAMVEGLSNVTCRRALFIRREMSDRQEVKLWKGVA